MILVKANVKTLWPIGTVFSIHEFPFIRKGPYDSLTTIERAEKAWANLYTLEKIISIDCINTEDKICRNVMSYFRVTGFKTKD